MKKLLSVILALMLCLMFAGCKETKSEEKPADTSSVTSSEEAVSSETQTASIGMIKKGLWEVIKDGTRTGYYYFSENGKECKYKDAELKSGVPFDYEIKDTGYIFHMGAADNNTPVSLKEDYSEDAAEFTLLFEDREENIKYIEDCTIEEYVSRQ